MRNGILRREVVLEQRFFKVVTEGKPISALDPKAFSGRFVISVWVA